MKKIISCIVTAQFMLAGLSAEEMMSSEVVVVASNEQGNSDVSMGHGSGGPSMHSSGGMGSGGPGMHSSGGGGGGPGMHSSGGMGGGMNLHGGGMDGGPHMHGGEGYRMEGHEHHGSRWWPWNWRYWGEPEYRSSGQYGYAEPQYVEHESYQHGVDLRYFLWPILALFIVIVGLLWAIYRRLNRPKRRK